MFKYNPRYARHYSLDGFGEAAQEKLSAAKVLVIGAGGLGCPALQYLAAAGLGTIGIADADVISITNLQRQVLYGTDDIGKNKTDIAATRLGHINNEITIVKHTLAISNENALDIITEYDLVLDCTDNFTARYIINDACVILGKPFVSGAIYQYEGQVSVFNADPSEVHSTNYRDLFPAPPNATDAVSCSEVGVLGVLPGVIGTLQATEVIKYITGIGELMVNKLLTINLLTYETYVLEIQKPESVHGVPVDRNEFEKFDYGTFCGAASPRTETITASAFLEKIQQDNALIIDVREEGELPVPSFDCINLPLSVLQHQVPDLDRHDIILFCQSGTRSLKAAALFVGKFGSSKNISHLEGGINSLQRDYYGKTS